MSELFGRCHPRLYRWALGATGRDVHLAQDVISDAWLRIFEAMGAGRFEPGRPFEPWAFSVARHALYHHWRKAGAGSRLREVPIGAWGPEDEPDDGRRGLAAEPGLEDVIFAQIETANLVAAARWLLDEFPLHGQAVVMRYWEGMSGAAVADALGTTEDNIRQRCKRGLSKLRSYLAGLDGMGSITDDAQSMAFRR